MKQTTTTRYLNECLNLIDYPTLPDKLEEGTFWIKAIVLINKEVNPMYALAVRDEEGKPMISKVFTTQSILSIDEIYPYEVDNKIVKKVENTTLENFSEWKAKLKVEYPAFKQNAFTGKKYEDCKLIFADWLKAQESNQVSNQVSNEAGNEVNDKPNE